MADRGTLYVLLKLVAFHYLGVGVVEHVLLSRSMATAFGVFTSRSHKRSRKVSIILSSTIVIPIQHCTPSFLFLASSYLLVLVLSPRLTTCGKTLDIIEYFGIPYLFTREGGTPSRYNGSRPPELDAGRRQSPSQGSGQW